MSLLQVQFDIHALLIAAGLLVLFTLFHYRDGRGIGTERRDDLRTMKGYPLLGNVIWMIKNLDRNLEDITEQKRIAREEGDSRPMSLTLPFRRMTEISKPEWIEFVQKTRFDSFGKGPVFHDNMKEILGDGIFAVDGHPWRSQRKATSRVFTGSAFRGIITSSLESSLAKLMTILRHNAETGDEFALDELFFRFTLESFAEMAFGISVGALKLKGEPVPFAAAFDTAQEILASRFVDPFWKITEQFNGKARSMAESKKIIDAFCYAVIEKRQQEGLRGDKSQKKDIESLDLLSLYMNLNDETGKPLSKQALRDALLNLIIAGRDTTAQALSWTFFRLMKDPHLMAPIRKEADENGPVDYDSFRSMVQTNAAFDEGLRLHPSVPRNVWTVLKDEQIPNGPFVKAGDFITWNDWFMGRDPTLWENASEYRPSRWIDENGKLIRYSTWQNHVFNGGYRLCLGQDLAKYEACAVLSGILKEFDITFAPGYLENVAMVKNEDSPRYRSSLTLPMLEPLRVKVAFRQR